MRLAYNNESILPPSRCRGCNKNLSWQQLIPIFSWLFQLGLCGCKKKIRLTPYYFISELLLGLVFIYIGHYIGLSILMIPWLIFASILFFLFLTDFMCQLLHVPTMISGILIGLLFSFQQEFFFEGCVGAALGYLIILIPNFIFLKLTNKKGFGDGDSYLMAFIGSWMGPVITIQALVLASWIGVCFVGIYYAFLRKIVKKLPLGVLVIIGLIMLQLFAHLIIKF